MKKDVIYIDIEDDITSIISKVKEAEAKIVALVPPKRIGVLQSVVNLKLLNKAAHAADKRIVLITSNSALTSLAAGVSMPVAKNLQSKPEVPEVTALEVDDEDIIKGEDLPIGDHARMDEVGERPRKTKLSNSEDAALSAVIAAEQTEAATAASKAPTKARARAKVPNFDTFRKKLFIFGGLGVLLVAFFVWAVFFAPRATVEISAKTDPTSINKILTLLPDGELDAAQAALPLLSEETKKTQSVEVTATGKKEVGEKATGTVNFSKSSPGDATIAAGTTLRSSGGLAFITDSAVTVPGAQLSFDCEGYLCPGSASVSVTAAERGSKYNGASGSVSGTPSGVSASFDDATSGGTDKTATVVSRADVDRAKEELKKQDIDEIREELVKQFEGNVVIIQESLAVKTGDPSVSPGVGEEAAKAQLAVETTYTLYAVARDDLKTVFDDYLKTQMSDEDSQKIYASGDNKVQFSEFEKEGDNYQVRVQATGYIGPQIDEDKLKQQVTGMRAGEVREVVESIEGVQKVETNFWPFWVTTVPSVEKTTIKFIVQDEQS